MDKDCIWGGSVKGNVQKVCGHGSAELTMDSMILDVFFNLTDQKIF